MRQLMFERMLFIFIIIGNILSVYRIEKRKAHLSIENRYME